jgi:hypothetical protein
MNSWESFLPLTVLGVDRANLEFLQFFPLSNVKRNSSEFRVPSSEFE